MEVLRDEASGINRPRNTIYLYFSEFSATTILSPPPYHLLIHRIRKILQNKSDKFLKLLSHFFSEILPFFFNIVLLNKLELWKMQGYETIPFASRG